MNILIVDDEQFLREDLKEAVDRVSPGNTFCFADNYDSAIKQIDENEIDLAFLDIEMPGKSGLELAKTIKRKSRDINIIMVTAYAQYALSALRLYVSGYILKPVMDDELNEAMDNLRKPVAADDAKKLKVRCFGNFEVFNGDSPVYFSRSKAKEMLAYLVCLKGSGANRNEICANILEDMDEAKGKEYFKKIYQSLKKDLDAAGVGDILIHGRNSYAINVNLIDCDYYDFLAKKEGNWEEYHGEFLNQYSWAEVYIYALDTY